MKLNRIPLFEQLEGTRTVLLAGAGGGWDVLCTVPLMEALRNQGMRVVLANLSFSWLEETTSREVHPGMWHVKPGDTAAGLREYFPEGALADWLAQTGRGDVPLYAFDRVGVQPLRAAYEWLLKEHQVDAIVLVDGGTDILMRGDEHDLGTPHEDIASLAAVNGLQGIPSYLACLGFGVDHYHGVSHYRFLENASALIRSGGFLGSFHLLSDMPEGKAFLEAVQFVNDAQPGMEGIVSNSIRMAMLGHFGDVHFSDRTAGSELFLNPLMAQYWAFRLHAVAEANLYLHRLEETHTMGEVANQIVSH